MLGSFAFTTSFDRPTINHMQHPALSRTLSTLLTFTLMAVNSWAQAESKEIKELRAQAEKGDAGTQYSLGAAYAKGEGVTKNSAEAAKWFRKAAEQGGTLAQYNLGIAYANGDGVPKDSAEAAKWFRMAAEPGEPESHRVKELLAKAKGGDVSAQFQLGFIYAFGETATRRPINTVEGIKWILKSAEQGKAEAQDLIGLLHHEGKVMPKDTVAAVQWFRKAAEQGYAYAQFNLGYCYHKGEGVPKDPGEAAKWLRLAAKQGELHAQSYLAEALDDGDGLPKDSAEAAKWFRHLALRMEVINGRAEHAPPEHRLDDEYLSRSEMKPSSFWREAAERGDAQAQFNLGFCFDRSSDAQEALKWYVQSANQGFAQAQFNLGCYYYNRNGVSFDNAEALKWFRKSADQGYAKAQFNLGWYYSSGERELRKIDQNNTYVESTIGVPKNPIEAEKWYRKAAEQGHARAQFKLAKIYYSGDGVPKDAVEAVKWWRLAAQLGHPTAQYNLGVMYFTGQGITKDFSEASKWFRKASEQPLTVFRCGNGMPASSPMLGGKSQQELTKPVDGFDVL